MCKQILWIDNEISYLRKHIDLLKDAGYSVTETKNVEDGLALLDQINFDLIILDILMA